MNDNHKSNYIAIHIILLLLPVLILFPQLARADVAFGLFDGWMVNGFFIFVPIEIIFFYLFFNRLFFRTKIVKKKISLIKSTIIVIIANIISTFLGHIINFSSHDFFAISHVSPSDAGIILGVAFILTIILEWIVYIPCFEQIIGIKKRLNLFKLSVLTNLIPYLLLGMMIIPETYENSIIKGTLHARIEAQNFYGLALAHFGDKGYPADMDHTIKLSENALPTGFHKNPDIIYTGSFVADTDGSLNCDMTFRHKKSSTTFYLDTKGGITRKDRDE